MALGRRKVGLDDPSAWVFNRMADVYDARPPYPDALVSALAALVPAGGRVADLGAGIGHLALPLAAHGLSVIAIEPAQKMLDRLRDAARERGLTVDARHATAEAPALAPGSIDLAIVADALHFLDAERAGLAIGAALSDHGALALVTCQLADTPFMRSLIALMEEAAPRRPRAVQGSVVQLCALARVSHVETRELSDETPVDPATLERILRSISFIGPAMNAARFADFRARLRALPDEPRWARSFTLHIYRRGPRSPSARDVADP